MAKYIDRKAAVAALLGDEAVHIQTLLFAQKRIEALPAADVVEVRHGRWLSMDSDKVIAMDDDGYPVDSCRCSECGDWLVASDEYPVRGRYCPNCGAKMDESEGENNV